MNTKEKIFIMQAFLDGKVIQLAKKGVDQWLEALVEPTWNWDNCVYRIKPQKQLVIPWEHIKPKYKWAAMDEDGEVFVYVTAPEVGNYKDWQAFGVSMLDALNIDTDDIDWKQSLVQRPEGV